MIWQSSNDFDVADLYAALDAERRTRGITWQQVTREINGLFGQVPVRSLSASTIVRAREGRIVEGDSALQMLRWLGRTPESFLPDAVASTEAGNRLPSLGPHQILRFDSSALYSALDAQRRERGLTWPQAANEIGGWSAASLRRLEQGGRVGFLSVMRLFRWLGRPAASFTRASNR